MTKKEIYNAVVEIYKKTGQGIPRFVWKQLNDSFIQELIDEGKLKKVTISYSHVPDDEFLCLTKGFCPEEGGKNTTGLTFMRVYLGVNDLGLGITQTELFKDKDNKKHYEEWLATNADKLKETDEILAGRLDEAVSKKSSEEKKGKPTKKTKPVLSKAEIEHLKERGCYERNESVKNVNKNITESIDVNDELIGKLRQIIPLCEMKKEKYKEEIVKYKFELEENLKEGDILHNTSIWLCNIPDDSVPIQSVLK